MTFASATILTRRPATMKRLLGSSMPCQRSFRCRYNSHSMLMVQRFRPSKGIALAGTAFVGCCTATLLQSTLYSTCMPENPMESDESKQAEESILACSSSSLALKREDDLLFLRRFVTWIQAWIRHLWNIVSVSTRSAEIAIRLSPLIMLTPIAMLAERIRAEEGNNYLSEVSWAYAISAIQGLGPVAVKLCQWAGTLLQHQVK